MSNLISREDVNKILFLCYWSKRTEGLLGHCAEAESGAVMQAIEIIQKAVNDLPAIEERKVGRWLNYEGHPLETKEGCPVDEAYCSVCGGLLCASDEYMCTGLYCPTCGAKMEQTDGYELEET